MATDGPAVPVGDPSTRKHAWPYDLIFTVTPSFSHHPARAEHGFLDGCVMVVAVGWLALAADAGGELFEVADVARDVFDGDRLPSGLVAGVRPAQAKARGGRLDGLDHDRAFRAADLELAAPG